jgi:hypothetical protein
MTQEYPKWKFKQGTKDGKPHLFQELVNSAAADAKLGEGWSDDPLGGHETFVPQDMEKKPAPVAAKAGAEFPKVLYSKTAETVGGKVVVKVVSQVVADRAAQRALGKGWYESPDGHDAQSASPAPKVTNGAKEADGKPDAPAA